MPSDARIQHQIRRRQISNNPHPQVLTISPGLTSYNSRTVMACGDDIGHAVGKLTLRHDLEHSVCQAPSEALLALLAFTSPSCLLPWVGHGRGGQERLCVRVAGRVCDDVHRPLFHDLSVAEYRHPVRHVAYDGEVVGDEQVAEAEFPCRSCRRLRTWAWMERSRELVGSSQMTMSGSRIRARAMAMRWRCPPENCAGWRRAASVVRPTRSRTSAICAASSPRLAR